MTERILRVNEKAVRVFMANAGIVTMEELGNRTGLTQLTLRRLLAGDPFKSGTIQKLAAALNCNPLDILEANGYPAPHLGAPAIAAMM